MNKELIKKLAVTLKVEDLEAFEKAISEENASFETPKIKVYSEDEHSKLKIFTPELFTATEARIQQEGFEKGKVTGSEMRMKDVRNTMGIEVDGYKDNTTLVSAYKAHVLKEAKLEPDEKTKGLLTDVDKLRGTIETNEKSYNEKELGYKNQILSMKSDTLLSSLFKDSDGLISSHKVAIFKAEGYGVKYDENNTPIPTKNGVELKNETTREIRNLSDVSNEFEVLNKWNVESGRDEGDTSGPNAFKTMNEVFDYMEEKGINPESPEGGKLQDDFNNKKD